MTDLIVNRRRLIAGAATGLVAVPAISMIAANPALADQGNMEHAMRLLGNAIEALRQATPNKGGHRERAIELVQSAMGEVQAGIDFADAH